jgi:1-acyl-sn-glycerol-3-phosphate acyltransferase
MVAFMRNGGPPGAVLLTTVFFGGLFLWTALYLPLALPVWLVLTRAGGISSANAVRRLVHCYGSGCCKLLARLTPITVENRAGALPAPCIIAANHQSFFDPYCIGFFPVPYPVFVVRAWPFRIPLYGRIMRRAGYLNIEDMDAESFLRKASDILRKDKAMLVVFPEGTRSADGKPGRFRSGAFRLAVDCNIPVVPLCINGTGKVFPKGSRFGRPAPVRVTLLPPLYPERFAGCGESARLHLRRSVKHAVREALLESPAG